MKTSYEEKYCGEHDQHYSAHLKGCPICAGVKMGGKMIHQINVKEPEPDGGLILDETC